MDNEIEIWKDVGVYNGIDYTGMYEASTFGNVRSLDRETVCKNGRIMHHKGKILEPGINSSTGYNLVVFSKNGETTTIPVHQLIMYLFNPSPNPEIYTDINHIDEDKTNNKLDNLEWVTHEDNCNYGTRNKKVSICRKERSSRVIVQVDEYGNICNQWNSARKASQELCISYYTILKTINTKNKNNSKFILLSLECYNSLSQDEILKIIENTKRVTNDIEIVQLTIDGKFISEWKSIAKAAKELNINSSNICRCLKHRNGYKMAGGFKWVYSKDYYNQ